MIDLMLTSDEEELVQTVRHVLEREYSQEMLLQGSLETVRTNSLIRKLGELGWFSLAVPESSGGAGLSLTEEVLLFRELGRALVPGPVVATALAAQVAHSAGLRELATKFGEGSKIAGLAELPASGDEAIFWDAGVVDYLLVVDVTNKVVSLVRREDLGEIESTQTIDPYYGLSLFENSDLALVARLDSGTRESDAIIARGRVLTAAVLSGIAERARDESTEYAKNRLQYGKPIGSFQAVKHRCADMALRSELSWAQTVVATLRVKEHNVSASDWDVVSAKIVAADSAVRNCRDNIQNHGGMGYTAENAAHLLLKRSHILQQHFGDARSLSSLLLVGSASW